MKKIIILLLASLLVIGGVIYVVNGYKFVPESGPESLHLTKTVTASPDENYGFGAFCRVNYVESKDQFVVTFGGAQPAEVREENRAGGLEGGGGYAYKFYSTDFEYTGEHGVYVKGGGDAAVTMAEGTFYHLTGGGNDGWRLLAYDPATFEEINMTEIAVDSEKGALNDQMLAFVNGHLVASSLYKISAEGESGPDVGEATHHTLLDLDLEQINYFVLNDELHTNGSSMLYLDGTYYFVASTAYWGDLIVMMYDEDWTYLGSKILVENAQWPQGIVYDQKRQQLYIAYVEINKLGAAQGTENNVRLGIFDENWEHLETIKITDYRVSDLTDGGRPSLFMYQDKLYVSYDIGTQDSDTNQSNYDWNCIVDIYEF